MANRKPTLYLIDGSNNLYRSYYAIRGLTNSKGLSTNAVYGFTQMLRKLLKEHQPDAVAVAFDVKGKTFRHEQFEDYKKERKPMPDDLVVQVPLVREVCEGFGLPILEYEGFEADDVLGTLACRARDAGYNVVLATSDKDFFQLVGEGITLYHTGREAMFDRDAATEAFGLPPEKVADVMGLWGDAIDGIPGVPGIGEKGAKQLISEFGSLDELLEKTAEIKRKSHREKLEEFREQALLSRDLATIRCDLELDVDFSRLALGEPDRSALHHLFSRLEFQSLMQEYMPERKVERDVRVVTTTAELDDLLRTAVPIALHIETERPDGQGGWVAVSVATSLERVYVIPIKGESADLLREKLCAAFSDGRRLIAHDVKQHLRTLVRAGQIDSEQWDDTMIESYVLQPGLYGHSLENLCRGKLHRDCLSSKDVAAQQGLFELDHDFIAYMADRAEVTFSLHQLQRPQIEKEEGLEKIYREMELPLIPVLERMERKGIRIDREFLGRMSEQFGTRLKELETEIYREAGEEFNINSPGQLGTILFEKLDYPVIRKTQKTKNYSTSVDVLDELASRGFSIPRLILDHRELHKLKSTYVDALPQLVAADGRVHTTFNQAIAATGRLSSSDPNLQNIPIRTELGREIRKGFIADDGNVLLSADYSQIELRVLAHMCGDEDLIEAFRRGADIHRTTASRIFGLSEDAVTPEQRRASKTINFGVLYGMSAFRLGNELGISTGEAKSFIDAYFNRYPKIRELLDRTLEEARETGKVSTLFGRVRYIPEIHNRSFTVRANAERMATNAPIQGTAADLLKMAMIALDRAIEQSSAKASMLLTVHDEIVLEASRKDVEEIEALVRRTMENVYPLAVPLAVDTHWGRSWYEAKE
ncbi:MAG: DNA polymerase I [Acidobacteria bacterium]|nr:DNA polymerase I [Acidobacteriota bacterium]